MQNTNTSLALSCLQGGGVYVAHTTSALVLTTVSFVLTTVLLNSALNVSAPMAYTALTFFAEFSCCVFCGVHTVP